MDMDLQAPDGPMVRCGDDLDEDRPIGVRWESGGPATDAPEQAARRLAPRRGLELAQAAGLVWGTFVFRLGSVAGP